MDRTYVRESAFSIMNQIKSKTRTCRLDSQMLSVCLRLALTEIPVSDGWGQSPPPLRKTAIKYFYDTRYYFNVRSKADIVSLIYRMEPTTKKCKTEKVGQPCLR